jgi:hypothetical protein
MHGTVTTYLDRHLGRLDDRGDLGVNVLALGADGAPPTSRTSTTWIRSG